MVRYRMGDPLLPLCVATFLILASVLVPQARMNWPLWLRALWGIGIFAVLTVLLWRLIGSPLRPHFDSAHPGEQFWQKLIEAGWWLMGAKGAIGIGRLVIVLEHRPRETKIVSDLLAGMVYIATTLAIVNFVFAVPIGGLLATSGIIAIVLGLALQSTLADVFSGIAVGLERPYKAGDLVWVEGGIEGQVIQVTWRSTQITTGENNIAIVPNSVIAKARLVNHSLPTTIRSDTVEVRLDAGVTPDVCIAALTAATRTCRILLTSPAPAVICAGLNGDGNLYKINYSVGTSRELMAARNELFTEMHRHLRHGGIALAVAGTATVRMVPIPTPSQLLEQSDLFCVIEPAQRDFLAEHFKTIWLRPGETLIQEGGAPDALYVVASGAAEITIEGPAGPNVVHRISPGESIGALGLITGSNYAATATALTAMKVYRLDKDAIATAIKAEPDLVHGLEELAKRGQAALRRDAAGHKDEEQEHPEMFLSKLRGLVKLLASR